MLPAGRGKQSKRETSAPSKGLPAETRELYVQTLYFQMHVHLERETKHYNHATPHSNHLFAFKNTQNAMDIHYSLMAHFGQVNQVQENERPGLLLKMRSF